jgi:hypothetical protein
MPFFYFLLKSVKILLQSGSDKPWTLRYQREGNINQPAQRRRRINARFRAQPV